jgi:SNF2 family DNA or RNA helicase
MSREFVPRPYQHQIVDHILNVPRCAVWAGMGMGKTSATLTALDALALAGEVGKVLVVAPLRVARTTWPEEPPKWNHLKHLRVVPIVGTPAERKAAMIEDADIFSINYENLPWLVSHWQYAWPYDTLVLDEATKLKSARIQQGSKRAAELQTIIYSKVHRVIELTGTPAPNGLADLYGQMLLLDRGQRLGRTYAAFENRWFGFQRASDAVSNGRNYVKRIAFPHAQAEIQALLKDICLTLDAKDWFPIDEPIVTNVYVDLPPDARRMYRNMEQELFAEIQGYGIEAFNAASKSIKCLQLANGASFTGSDEAVENDTAHWVEVHTEKLDALDSIISESGGVPVLVAYHFKPDRDRILKRFPQAVHIKTKAEEAAFKAGHIEIGLVHAQSIGHGVDGFQNATNILIFFAHWWAMEDRAQLIERIGPVRQIQSGHITIAGRNRPVMLYNIVARGTVDLVVLERLESKVSVQQALTNFMKRRMEDGTQSSGQ